MTLVIMYIVPFCTDKHDALLNLKRCSCMNVCVCQTIRVLVLMSCIIFTIVSPYCVNPVVQYWSAVCLLANHKN